MILFNERRHTSNRLYQHLIVAIALIFSVNNIFAEELGRLFTTPKERSILEKLRHQQPVEIRIPEIAIEQKPDVDETKPVIGGITVNGLVYRSDGKNTAWINNNNTFEGDLGNQYIQIDAKNIDPDKVIIEIPLNNSRVKLKTGETYDPEKGEIESFNYREY